MPAEKLEDESKIHVLNREDELRKRLINDLENTSDVVSEDMKTLQRISPKVLKRIERAIEDETLTPYKAAVAYSKCVDSVVKMANVRMGLFDRLSGTIGAYGVNTEEKEADEFENAPMEIQREAERWLYQLVKAEVEEKKRLSDSEEGKRNSA